MINMREHYSTQQLRPVQIYSIDVALSSASNVERLAVPGAETTTGATFTGKHMNMRLWDCLIRLGGRLKFYLRLQTGHFG